jgi:hypothetical protein
MILTENVAPNNRWPWISSQEYISKWWQGFRSQEADWHLEVSSPNVLDANKPSTKSVAIDLGNSVTEQLLCLENVTLILFLSQATIADNDLSKKMGYWEPLFDSDPFDKKIRGLRSIYQFVNESEIMNYIKSNSRIIDCLDNISQNIDKYFSVPIKLKMEMLYDSEDNSEHIYVAILVDETTESAFDMLAKFENEWLYNNINITQYNIIFDINYK